MDQKTVVEWVDQLGAKLIEMREVVVEREKAAKASMKAQYDKKAPSAYALISEKSTTSQNQTHI